MSQIKIEKLTQKQEALIPVYREKWRRIALSTAAIDPQKSSNAIKAAYELIGYQEPEIIVCDSPFAACYALVSQKDSQLGSELGSLLVNQLYSQLVNQLENQLWSQLWNQLWNQLHSQLDSQLESQLYSQLDCQQVSILYCCISPEYLACYSSLFDFCISVLNCTYEPKKWQILQLLISDCGWIFPCEKTCYVCSRPRILSFDSQQRLHAEGEPAIQYADGFSVYAYHGVIVPEK